MGWAWADALEEDELRVKGEGQACGCGLRAALTSQERPPSPPTRTHSGTAASSGHLLRNQAILA
eukprot:2795558-Prymnesium_polylepis.1